MRHVTAVGLRAHGIRASFGGIIAAILAICASCGAGDEGAGTWGTRPSELSGLGEGPASAPLLTDPSLLRPVLECVTEDGPGAFTAHYGYLNTVAEDVQVGVGTNNKFTPAPQDRGQPTLFAPGRHYDVFQVPFNGSNLVWKLGPRTSTASANSIRCAGNVAPTVTASVDPASPGHALGHQASR